MSNISNAVLENVRIGFRNFAGNEGRYNPKGKRNFVVFLDPPIADQMSKEGWNVKVLTPREEGDEPQAYLPVSLAFGRRPPHIVMITSKGQTRLDEEMVESLDWAEISNVDLVVRPYEWEVNGSTGIKAYLKSLFVTIEEDELEKKYAEEQISD